MQMFYLTDVQMIVLFFILWPIFQLSAAFICRKLPDSYFQYDKSIYRTRDWERNGKVYERIFKVHKWKKFLPDGASLGKKGFRKKRLDSFSKPVLKKYLIESCRAEFIHWAAIIPFWVFGLFSPPRVVLYMLLYALLVNVPCIVAQRYNRPRVAKLLKKMDRKTIQ